jgi:hypothetical protein
MVVDFQTERLAMACGQRKRPTIGSPTPRRGVQRPAVHGRADGAQDRQFLCAHRADALGRAIGTIPVTRLRQELAVRVLGASWDDPGPDTDPRKIKDRTKKQASDLRR